MMAYELDACQFSRLSSRAWLGFQAVRAACRQPPRRNLSMPSSFPSAGTKATELMWELKELFDPEYVLNPGEPTLAAWALG